MQHLISKKLVPRLSLFSFLLVTRLGAYLNFRPRKVRRMGATLGKVPQIKGALRKFSSDKLFLQTEKTAGMNLRVKKLFYIAKKEW